MDGWTHPSEIHPCVDWIFALCCTFIRLLFAFCFVSSTNFLLYSFPSSFPSFLLFLLLFFLLLHLLVLLPFSFICLFLMSSSFTFFRPVTMTFLLKSNRIIATKESRNGRKNRCSRHSLRMLSPVTSLTGHPFAQAGHCDVIRTSSSLSPLFLFLFLPSSSSSYPWLARGDVTRLLMAPLIKRFRHSTES